MKVIKVIMNFFSIFAQLLITSYNSEISSAVLSMVPLVLQIEIWDFIFIFGLLGVKRSSEGHTVIIIPLASKLKPQCENDLIRRSQQFHLFIYLFIFIYLLGVLDFSEFLFATHSTNDCLGEHGSPEKDSCLWH